MASKQGKQGQQSKKKTAKSKKPVQFQLTWTGFISWGVFAFVVVAWAFILGVLVGRGYQPETFFPLVADIMPGNSGPKAFAPKPEKNVLSAQDLGFYDTLQAETGTAGNTPAHTRPEPKPAPKPAPKRQQEPATQGPVSVYTYQVGAFRRQAQAGSLQRDLSQKGISADVEKTSVHGTLWYRVLVRYHGTPAKADAFTSRLRRMGVHKFFLRSKK